MNAAGSVCPLRRFWEDRMLAGFIPLGNTLSTQDILSISELKTLDKQVRGVAWEGCDT